VTGLAHALYQLNARYLLEHGWSRDGLDSGVWHYGGGINPPGVAFGEAVQTQLERDGVNMQTFAGDGPA
jgi:hypothetical protein